MKAMNILKWIPMIIKGMDFAQKVKGAKGKDRAAIAMEEISNTIKVLEGSQSQDILNDEAVQAAILNGFTAIKAIEKAIQNAKRIRNVEDEFL